MDTNNEDSIEVYIRKEKSVFQITEIKKLVIHTTTKGDISVNSFTREPLSELFGFYPIRSGCYDMLKKQIPHELI
jgi:hypothetical protein